MEERDNNYRERDTEWCKIDVSTLSHGRARRGAGKAKKSEKKKTKKHQGRTKYCIIHTNSMTSKVKVTN